VQPVLSVFWHCLTAFLASFSGSQASYITLPFPLETLLKIVKAIIDDTVNIDPSAAAVPKLSLNISVK
jgi:hypothetical protein